MKHSPDYYFTVAMIFIFPAVITATIGMAAWWGARPLSLALFSLSIICLLVTIAHLWAFKRSLPKRVDNPVVRAARAGAFDSFIEAQKRQKEEVDRHFWDQAKAWQPHDERPFISNELLKRCRISYDEAELFRSESRKVQLKDEDTGSVVTAYIHPEKGMMIDSIEQP